MTDTEAALLNAIAAMPAEDTPRLAFADYLDELGGAGAVARAEFIRLQVMLSRIESETHETIAARVRAAELRDRYGAVWGFPQQNEHQPWYVVRRGFIDELTVDGALVTEIRHLLHREPVTRVRLALVTADGTPAGIEWLDIPPLRKVRQIELAGSHWRDEGIIRLLSFAHFPELANLAVVSTRITPVGVSAIADCERLRGLTALRVSFRSGAYTYPEPQSGVGDAGARALAASPHLAELRELSLRDGRIGTAGALALAESPHLGALTSLVLTENPDIDQDARAALVARFGEAVFLSPVADP
jgi:uncharacterized protein (TIGR02996 family)